MYYKTCMYNVSPFFHLSQRLHQLQHPLGAHIQSSSPFAMVFGYPKVKGMFCLVKPPFTFTPIS